LTPKKYRYYTTDYFDTPNKYIRTTGIKLNRFEIEKEFRLFVQIEENVYL